MKRAVILGILAGLATPALAQDGAALFKNKCTACHNEAKVMGSVRKMPEADRPARLEQHLAGHFAPDPAQRRAIVEHLLKAASTGDHHP